MALALGLAGVGYRLALLLLTVPGSNSDEATFGLAAMHIATRRERPVFLYGQHYMGTVEAYLAAPLVRAFGPSWIALRIPLLFLYAAFVFLLYRLTRRLYSPWLATFTVGLLALGSERVIRDQLTAVGGRPEVKPAVVLLLLLAVALGQRRTRHRWLAAVVFGVVAGLALWDDWLVLPYLAVTALVQLIACGRTLFGRTGLLVLGGFVVGLLPLLVDNLTAPPGQDSLSVFQQLSDGESAPASLAERLHGAILVGIPLASGHCPPGRCLPWHGWWGPAYLGLLLAGAVLAALGLRRSATPGAAPPDRDRIRYVAQLALLAGAGLTLVAYARNALAGTAPIASARYLSILQISLPAVLWPFWLAVRWLRPGSGPSLPQRLCGGLAAAALAAVSAASIYATAVLITQIPVIRSEERDARELATAVRRAGIRYAFGEYWTCNRLIFNAGEKVICAVLGEDLRPGQNRYPPYPARVFGASRPAFVFESGGAADSAFRAYLARTRISATVIPVGDYRIYKPAKAARPWR